jgi:hypothetical protein
MGTLGGLTPLSGDEQVYAEDINVINLQKAGGIAALYLALSHLTGLVIFLFVLDYPNIIDPLQKVALLVDKQMLITLTNLFMYVVFGILLIILTLALYARLTASSTAILRIAASIGIVWAGVLIASGMVANAGIPPVVALYAKDPSQAALAWMAIESVANGLGGAYGEILGGLLTLLISWAALQVKDFTKGLNFLGISIGAVGIISTIPSLGNLAGLFGLGQIVWFVWLGTFLIRGIPRGTVY